MNPKKIAIIGLISYAMTFALEANITVQPDTIVEVGEEVNFRSDNSRGIIDPSLAVYEWDFGDGYSMMKGYPTTNSAATGPNCIHYFMKPGNYKIRLFISENGVKDTAERKISVTGEAPIAGFELWKASYHGRITQYVYVKIPETIYANNTNRLLVRLIRNKQDTTKILSKIYLKSTEKFLLQNGKLPSGNYELLVELKNNLGRISYIKEKFSKSYNGNPKIGINEHNAICVNGEPFFPVMPFIKNKEFLAEWSGKYINSANGEGYYTTHNISTWIDYLQHCDQNGIKAMGPVRWDGKSNRNSSILKMEQYVKSARDLNSMMMWNWDDEPNLGGRDKAIPEQVIASWSYVTRNLDPHHLVATNFYGYTYLPYYKKGAYDYLYNAEKFGGKKHAPFDVLGFDIYPIQYNWHASLKGRRVISDYCSAIDSIHSRNYNLFPVLSFIEVQKIDETYVLPKPREILMEAWLNVVHGVKGIQWFHFFGETPKENLDAMATFYNQIQKYSSIILSPNASTKITDNANIPGKRVDFTVRKKWNGIDSSIYIFAVRVTEPDSGNSGYVLLEPEPENFRASFTISGIKTGKVISELDSKVIPLINGVFIDTFSKRDVKIYRIDPSTQYGIDPVSTIPLIQKKNQSIFLPQFGRHIKLAQEDNRSQFLYLLTLSGKIVGKAKINGRNVIFDRINGNGMYIVKSDLQKHGEMMVKITN